MAENFDFKPLTNDTAKGSTPSSGDKTVRNCGIGCGGIILAVIVAVAIGSLTGGSDDEPYDANWSGEAIAQCEELVEQSLKSPSTAEFDTTAAGSGTWIVAGTVDSENSFGATLRAEFQCTVIIEGSSIKRRLDYLD